MFLAFVLIALFGIVFGVMQITLSHNTDKNLAPARAYAQNMTQWHQAALVTANITPKPDCKNLVWGGNTGWNPPCILQFPTSILTTAQQLSPGYSPLVNWQSWYYVASDNEAYVITAFTNPNNNLQEAGYLTPDYLTEGLKQNMGYDRSGIGIFQKSADPNILEFSPLSFQGGTPDQSLPILNPHNQAPANFTPNDLTVKTGSSAHPGRPGIMTRAQ